MVGQEKKWAEGLKRIQENNSLTERKKGKRGDTDPNASPTRFPSKRSRRANIKSHEGKRATDDSNGNLGSGDLQVKITQRGNIATLLGNEGNIGKKKPTHKNPKKEEVQQNDTSCGYSLGKRAEKRNTQANRTEYGYQTKFKNIKPMPTQKPNPKS